MAIGERCWREGEKEVGRKREMKGRREGRRVEDEGEDTEREGWKMEGGERGRDGICRREGGGVTA